MSVKYEEAISSLTGKAFTLLKSLPKDIAKSVREIHLRAGRPIHLLSAAGPLFLGNNGQTFPAYTAHLPTLTQEDLEQCLLSICDYSLHTHQQDLAQGFVTLRGGHRAGIAGCCVVENGKIVSLREISSVCLRIAHEFYGCAEPLVQLIHQSSGGLLIAGTPGSGKTTLLRDLARSLSDDYHNVTIVDERGELAAMHNGYPQLNIGICSDVLSGYAKGTGIEMAVRTLSPEFVFCDEIGGIDDLEALRQAVCRGVRIAATVHAATPAELLSRQGMRELLATGAFSNIVFLESKTSPGKVTQILSLEEITL